jgi:hypothetical protein
MKLKNKSLPEYHPDNANHFVTPPLLVSFTNRCLLLKNLIQSLPSEIQVLKILPLSDR